MIIRTLEKSRGTAFDVTTEGQWNSVRLLVASDKMGFSFHVTTIFAGVSLLIHYEHHLEAVYCLSGAGTLSYDDGKQTQELLPGTLYALDQHDKHILTAHEELRLICVFHPAIMGHEKHNTAGGYEPAQQTEDKSPPYPSTDS